MDKKVSMFLTPEQVDDNPRFARLLSDLFTFSFSANGTTKFLHEKLTLTRNDFNQKEEEYLTLSLLYSEVWKIVNGISLTRISEDETEKDEVQEALINSEMKVYGSHDNYSALLGSNLQEDDFILKKKTLHWLHDKLKSNLTEKNIQISSNELENTLKFTEKLENVFDHFALLCEILANLENLIKNRVLSLQLEQTNVNAKFAVTKLDMLLLKIQTLKLEILCETYKKDTVSALSQIAKQTQEKTEKLNSEIEVAETQLQRYVSIGAEFNKIVTEYTTIKENITQKKWTLEKLQLY